MPEFKKVAKTEDIPAGQASMVEVDGKEIALFNVGGSFHAIDNTCTHVGGPLCEGEIAGNEVTCPWHGAMFDHGHVVSASAFASWIHQEQLTFDPAHKVLPPYSKTYIPEPTRRGG